MFREGSNGGVNSAQAAILAGQHFNDRNCSVVTSDFCSPGRERHVEMETLVVNHKRTRGEVVSAAIACLNKGAHALLSIGTSTQASFVDIIADLGGAIALSSSATSPDLSDLIEHPTFVRTIPDDTAAAAAITALMLSMGWTRIFLINVNDSYGNAYVNAAKLLVSQLIPNGVVSSASYDLLVPGSMESAVTLARNSETHIIVGVINNNQVDELLFAADDAGLFEERYQWLVTEAITPLSAVEQSADPARMRRILTGVVQPLVDPVVDVASMAKLVLEVPPQELQARVIDPRIVDAAVPARVTPLNLNNDLMVLPSEGVVTHYAAFTYDAMWAISEALDAMAESGDLEKFDPTNHESFEFINALYPYLVHNVTFQGSTGPVDFNDHGDRDQRGLRIIYYSFPEGFKEGVEAATWTSAAGVVFSDEKKLTWQGGGTYPDYIPMDSRSPGEEEDEGFKFWWVAAGAAVLVILGASLFFRKFMHAWLIEAYGVYLTRAVKLRGPPGAGQPVALVVTDIQNSTMLWDQYPDAMGDGHDLHDRLLRSLLHKHCGYECSTEGDSFTVAFHNVVDAICWCSDAQVGLLSLDWPEELLDGGEAIMRPNESGEVPTKGDFAYWAMEGAAWEGYGSAYNSDDDEFVVKRTRRESHESYEIIKERLASFTLSPQTNGTTRKMKRDRRRSSEINIIKSKMWRGLRVRMGVHAGNPDRVTINSASNRIIYEGNCLTVTQLVASAACGGQVLVSGAVMERLPTLESKDAKGGLQRGFVHLGKHVLRMSPPPLPPSRPISVPTTPHVSTFRDIDEGESFDLASPSGSSLVTHLGVDRLLESAKSDEAMMGSTIKSTQEERDVLINHIDIKMDRSIGNFELPRPSPARGPVYRATQSFKRTSQHSSQHDPKFQNGNGRLRHRRSFGEASDTNSVVTTVVGATAEVEPELFTHDLVVVVPEALAQRCSNYPRPKTAMQLTPSYYSAPSRLGVTIVFTFIDGATDLYKMSRWAMDAAVRQHNECIRHCLAAVGGYECEEQMGNFLLVFARPSLAIQFMIQAQNMLLDVQWSEQLLKSPAASRVEIEGALVYNGLRVKMGATTGDATRRVPSHLSGRADYFGPIVNHAARIASMAHGGQMVVSNHTAAALQDAISVMDLSAQAMSETLVSLGKQVLRGSLGGALELFQVKMDSRNLRGCLPLKGQPPSRSHIKMDPAEAADESPSSSKESIKPADELEAPKVHHEVASQHSSRNSSMGHLLGISENERSFRNISAMEIIRSAAVKRSVEISQSHAAKRKEFRDNLRKAVLQQSNAPRSMPRGGRGFWSKEKPTASSTSEVANSPLGMSMSMPEQREFPFLADPSIDAGMGAGWGAANQWDAGDRGPETDSWRHMDPKEARNLRGSWDDPEAGSHSIAVNIND